MADMGSFIRRCLLFAVCGVMAYPFLIAVMSALLSNDLMPNLRYPLGGYGHLHSRMAELRGHKDVDVVFLGSSHAYRGFDPRIWANRGYRAFNLGSSAQTPLQTEVMAKAHVTGLHPSVVIFEVHPNTFTDEGVESAVDMIANRPIDAGTWCMALRIPNAKVINALGYGALRHASGRDDGFSEPARSKEDLYVGDGFVERVNGRFKAEGKLTRVSVEPLSAQWNAFQRTLEYLRAQDLDVILVEAPMTRWMYEGMYRDHGRFEELMNSSGRYINMNGKVALTDSLHFFTKGHLNQAGVRLFNEALIDSLRGRGWLPAPEAQ